MLSLSSAERGVKTRRTAGGFLTHEIISPATSDEEMKCASVNL